MARTELKGRTLKRMNVPKKLFLRSLFCKTLSTLIIVLRQKMRTNFFWHFYPFQCPLFSLLVSSFLFINLPLENIKKLT